MLILYSQISKEAHENLLKMHLHNFDKVNRERIGRYSRWQDAQLFLLGRLLLKEGMSNFYKKINLNKIKFTEFNKPYIGNNETNFNISHSGEIVIVAFTNDGSSIGIDIEKKTDIEVGSFYEQMTKFEINNIEMSKKKVDSFFEYWTQKEAVIKAHGYGLSIPLKSFEVREGYTIINSIYFYLQQIQVNSNYTCHLASNSKLLLKNIDLKNIKFDKIATKD